MRLLSVLLILIITTIGCGDTRIYNTPTSPTGTTPPSSTNKIEFRVSGNAISVRIRFSTPVDGLTQVVTSLPYVAQFSTTQQSMFLSIEAIPLSYAFTTSNPFMSAQIIVNGSLFREASSNEFTLNPIAASGTWRSGAFSSVN